MEVQVVFLYSHNSERKNTELCSLGNNLNYSYGLVVRVAYLLHGLRLGKNDV